MAEYSGRQKVHLPRGRSISGIKGCQGHLGDHQSTLPKECVGYGISSYCATRCSYGSKEGILSSAGRTCRSRLLLPVSRGDAGNLYWRERAFGDARNLLPESLVECARRRRGRDGAKGPSRSTFAYLSLAGIFTFDETPVSSEAFRRTSWIEKLI